MQIYILEGREQRGPFSLDEVRAKVQAGEYSPASLGWRDDSTEWQPLSVLAPSKPPVLPSLPLPPTQSAAVSSLRAGRSRAAKACVVGALVCGAIIVFGLIAKSGGVKDSATGGRKADGAKTMEVSGEGDIFTDFVPDGTTLYADEDTLRTMESEGEKDGNAGTAALERFIGAGKIWKATGNIRVKIVREGGPMGAVFLEAKDPNGLKQRQFWVVHRASVFSLKSETAERLLSGGIERHASDFIFTFTGDSWTNIGGAGVKGLNDMLDGIYGGQIPIQLASQYLFRRDAIDAELVNVVGEYLVYEALDNPRSHHQFALKRNPAIEQLALKSWGSLEAFYRDVKRSPNQSDNPLTLGPVVVTGMEPFSTASGLVKAMPVVQMVNLLP